MSLDEDIEAIRSRLTGDKKKDIDILFSCADEFSSRPYTNQINDRISDMLKEILKEEDPTESAILLQHIQLQSSRRYEKKLLKLRGLIHAGNYQAAIDLSEDTKIQVEEAIDDAKRSSEENPLTFRFFFSGMEAALSDTYFPGPNTVRLPFDFVSLMMLRAQVFFLTGDREKCLLSLHTALEYDPVSAEISFQMAEMQIKVGDELSCRMSLERAWRFLYEKSDYQRYFLLIGKYYEILKKDTAFAQKINRAFAKLDTPLKMKKRLDESARKRLTEDGFEIDLSDEVRNVLLEALTRSLKVNDDETYLDAFKILGGFFSDQEISALLQEENKRTLSE